MSFFVSRAVRGGSCRADVFARGETAVLCVADGAAPDVLMNEVRARVLDPAFDLGTLSTWADALGASTGTIVVLAPGTRIHVSAGSSRAWLVGANQRTELAGAHVGPELAERLIVATDGLFRHVAAASILEVVRTRGFWSVGDALVALTKGEDDVAVLVAER